MNPLSVGETTVYIAGPMRGYPRFNFDAFDEAQENLAYLGYSVISPASLDREIGFNPDDANALDSFDNEAAFERDVAAIRECDVIALLPGHEKSIGATAERCIGRWLRKTVVEYVGGPKPFGVCRHGESQSQPAEDILDEAKRLTSGERNNSYGPPQQDFTKTAAMWAAILGIDVDAKEVALCMIALKLSRATWSAKRDNWVDIAGYARCGYMCEREDC